MVDNQEKIYQIALSLVKGVGSVLWRKLIDQAGSAQAVFQTDQHALTQVTGTSKQLAYAILKQDTLPLAEKLLLSHQQKGIQIISIGESTYPERLRQIPQAPPLLYFQGNINLNSARMLSIVGTRKATHYGKQVVANLISELVPYQVIVISGLAYGIDIHAHQAALKQGLPTIGILASNLAEIYPATHKKIAQTMLQQGGLVSENPLKADLEQHQFPARNRIIAGMADATLVVEADRKSGALITANFANAYNREVFAVPGPIDAIYSRGTNHLIRNHQAHLITSGHDIAYIMGWEPSESTNQPKPMDKAQMAELTAAEQSVVQLLQSLQTSIHIDDLHQQTQIPLAKLSAILLQLELKDVIQCLPGNKYRLIN